MLDDNRDLLLITQIILKGQGYETILSTTIEEAMQKIKIHRPALILMDVFISDGDGRVFCNHLKKERETSDIRVIMMSGYNDGNLENTKTADDFLQKPFDYTDLLSRVQKQMKFNNQ